MRVRPLLAIAALMSIELWANRPTGRDESWFLFRFITRRECKLSNIPRSSCDRLLKFRYSSCTRSPCIKASRSITLSCKS
uniref:Putative secreted protein n=1 Tax=Anopheles marajoara TaxID=58244 RepID=A0A2M4CCT4_9DIPT